MKLNTMVVLTCYIILSKFERKEKHGENRFGIYRAKRSRVDCQDLQMERMML
jgi:hypothetical protein